MPPFIARSMPNSLPTSAPAPAPTLPCAGGSARGRLRRRHSRRRRRAGCVASPSQQVEQDRRRHDRHARRPDLRRRCRARRASASRRRRRRARTRCRRRAARRAPARPRCSGDSSSVSRVPGERAAHVDAGDRAGLAQHDGAAGRPARVGEVADREAGDVGHRPFMRRSAARGRQPRGSGEHARRVAACVATPRRGDAACRRRSSRARSGA